jgi:hypothetical protein
MLEYGLAWLACFRMISLKQTESVCQFRGRIYRFIFTAME